MKKQRLIAWIKLHVALFYFGSLWSVGVWFTALFGGPDLASLQGKMYFCFTALAGTPALIGTIVILIWQMTIKEKISTIACLCTPFVYISVYEFIRIYVTQR